MPETMIQTLKKFKNIEPGEDFKKRSLTLILNTPQRHQIPLLKNVFQAFQFGGAIVLASLILLVVFGSFRSQSQLAGLDAKNLDSEVQNLDLKIKLAEVKYYEDPLNKTDVALTNSSKTDNGKKKGVEELLKELVL